MVFLTSLSACLFRKKNRDAVKHAIIKHGFILAIALLRGNNFIGIEGNNLGLK
jgi:hypothetical protein